MTNEKEYYNNIAKQHKGIQAVMHTSKPLAWYRHFLEKIVLNRYLPAIGADNKILDIGCGSGRFFKLFRKNGYDICGIDFSKEIIKQAKDTYHDDVHIELKVSDSTHIPYKDNSFHYVSIILVLPHNDPKTFKKTITEAKRVLKPGGKIFIIDEPNTKGSVWNTNVLICALGRNFDFIEDRFIRSNTATKLLSNNNKIDIKTENASKIYNIQGNVLKDIIKIFIDMWIDIPSVLFRRMDKGFTRLLVFEKRYTILWKNQD